MILSDIIIFLYIETQENLNTKRVYTILRLDFVFLCSVQGVQCILCSYLDETRDIRSNITLCPKEFPRAKPKGTPEGKGLYLTVYPESSPNTDIISF